MPSASAEEGELKRPAELETEPDAFTVYARMWGFGYAAILTEASCIPDDVFLEAAKCLAGLSSDEDLERGRLFPPFSKIRETSAHIMAHLCQFFCDEGYGTKPQELRTGEEADWLQYVKKRMYNPSYCFFCNVIPLVFFFLPPPKIKPSQSVSGLLRLLSVRRLARSGGPPGWSCG